MRPVDVPHVHRQRRSPRAGCALLTLTIAPSAMNGSADLVVGAQAREAARELDVVRLGPEHERGELAHLRGQAVGRALDAPTGPRPRTGSRRCPRSRRASSSTSRARRARDVVGRAAEDVGHDLRGRRLVALALRRRAQRDHDLAEDVELDGRDLVVARELQLRVDVLRLGEVVRARVERRADAEAEQLAARLGLGAARLDARRSRSARAPASSARG